MISDGKAVERKIKDITIFIKGENKQRNMYCLIDANDDVKEDSYGYNLFNEEILFPSKEDLQKYVFG